MIRLTMALFGLLAALGVAHAQQPELLLDDDAPSTTSVLSANELEEKTLAVAGTLRCVVCKNQSIAISDAGLAKDMVNLVREKLREGYTEEETRAYIVERYGDFVLLKPKFTIKNIGLWFGPLLMLGIGVFAAARFIMTRKVADAPVQALTNAERQELQERLNGTK